MRWLLDTTTVSEPTKTRPHGGVIEWLESIAETDIAISTVTLMELERGIASLALRDASRASALRLWLDREVRGNTTILPFDERCAQAAGEMQSAETVPLADSMIAATASVNGLTVVTRNVSDFTRFPVPVYSPWTGT